MYQLRDYIIKEISQSFFSIYMPLFVIASVAILVDLAKYTAVIHITFFEMLKLYLFLLPQIFFFTLPVTFFIASTIALFRLSNDNETIVMFSLGISPKFILKTLLKPAFFLTLLLFFNFLILFPHATTMYRNFKAQKRSEAQFNISPSEFGHKFGDWLLYIGAKDKNGTYKDIFLFNKNQKEEILINAKSAHILHQGTLLALQLQNGQGYSYSTEKFSQMDFQTMFINDTLSQDYMKYETPLEYWQSNYRRANKDRKIILGTLFALFPIVSLLLIITIGIVHSRHQKSSLYLYIFLGIFFYFTPTVALQKPLGFATIPTVLIPWIIITYILYRKKIVARF